MSSSAPLAGLVAESVVVVWRQTRAGAARTKQKGVDGSGLPQQQPVRTVCVQQPPASFLFLLPFALPTQPPPQFQTTNRSREARAAEGQQRFSDGLKMDQLLPHTQGPGALRLAALCPRLVHVSIDERASCLGGMTNCLGEFLARGLRC